MRVLLFLLLAGCVSGLSEPCDAPQVSTCDWDYWYTNLSESSTRACTVLWPWAYWGMVWPDGSAQLNLPAHTAVASPVWSLQGRDGVLVVDQNTGACIFTHCIPDPPGMP